MPNTIHIPTPLRPFTDKQESVEVNGGTVGELLADLTKKYDGLRKHLYTEGMDHLLRVGFLRSLRESARNRTHTMPKP